MFLAFTWSLTGFNFVLFCEKVVYHAKRRTSKPDSWIYSAGIAVLYWDRETAAATALGYDLLRWQASSNPRRRTHFFSPGVDLRQRYSPPSSNHLIDIQRLASVGSTSGAQLTASAIGMLPQPISAGATAASGTDPTCSACIICDYGSDDLIPYPIYSGERLSPTGALRFTLATGDFPHKGAGCYWALGEPAAPAHAILRSRGVEIAISNHFQADDWTASPREPTLALPSSSSSGHLPFDLPAGEKVWRKIVDEHIPHAQELHHRRQPGASRAAPP